MCLLKVYCGELRTTQLTRDECVERWWKKHKCCLEEDPPRASHCDLSDAALLLGSPPASPSRHSLKGQGSQARRRLQGKSFIATSSRFVRLIYQPRRDATASRAIHPIAQRVPYQLSLPNLTRARLVILSAKNAHSYKMGGYIDWTKTTKSSNYHGSGSFSTFMIIGRTSLSLACCERN